MSWLKRWIKELLGINKLEGELLVQKRKIQVLKDMQDSLYDELKKYERVDADIGIRSNNTVILTGQFRGRGYIQFYDFEPKEFEHMVRQLRDMKKHALIRTIDEPIGFNFKGRVGL